METIRQDGKVILHSEDGVSIKMIFNNLTGRNMLVTSATSQSVAWDSHPAASSIAGTER